MFSHIRYPGVSDYTAPYLILISTPSIYVNSSGTAIYFSLLQCYRNRVSLNATIPLLDIGIRIQGVILFMHINVSLTIESIDSTKSDKAFWLLIVYV